MWEICVSKEQADAGIEFLLANFRLGLFLP